MGWMRFTPDERGNYLIPSLIISMGIGQTITFLKKDKFRELTTVSVENLAQDLAKEELLAWTEDSPTKDPDNKMVVIPTQEVARRYGGA